jgi:hypothetical protein
MDATDLRLLLSPTGLRLLDEVGPIEASADIVRVVSRLRAAGHPPELVAVVLEQARLRARARTKFDVFATRMLFTPDGLEQATRLRIAALHAGRFSGAGVAAVADLGCGIGGDAMALAALDVGVLAVERDEVTAAVAAYNLVPFPGARVEHDDATTVDLSDVAAVWLDPARRDARGRSRNPADWSPPLDWAIALATRMPAGIKLAPGLDRSLLPADMEAQWISADGEVAELVLWSGRLARPGVRRAALVLRDGTPSEMTGPGDAVDVPAGELGTHLVEPDGAVIRARLIGDLARAVDGRMIDPEIAWITTDHAVVTPFGAVFAVRERFPLDVKVLRRELTARGIGTLEIKKRGVDVDPAEFRRRLSLRGDGSATLVLTRIGGRRTAILADRV